MMERDKIIRILFTWKKWCFVNIVLAKLLISASSTRSAVNVILMHAVLLFYDNASNLVRKVNECRIIGLKNICSNYT